MGRKDQIPLKWSLWKLRDVTEVRIIMEIVATRLGDWSQVDNKPKDELLLALVKQRMWE